MHKQEGAMPLLQQQLVWNVDGVHLSTLIIPHQPHEQEEDDDIDDIPMDDVPASCSWDDFRALM